MTNSGLEPLHADFSGSWRKDKARSTSMQDAFELMHVPRLLRKAVNMVSTIRIQQDEDSLAVIVQSPIPMFHFTERYKLDGSTTTSRRRDLRRGGQRGQVKRLEGGTEIVIANEWDNPHAAASTEHFAMPSPDELCVHAVLARPDGGTAKFTTVYTRK